MGMCMCNVFKTQSVNLQASKVVLSKKVKELEQTSQSLEVSLSKGLLALFICSTGLCLLLVLVDGTV